MTMSVKSTWRALISLVVLLSLVALQNLSTAEGLFHEISGVVKHVDKDAKTMVVKASDGTEHTIKWTGRTSWEGTQETGKSVKEGSQVTVKYTEKGSEKTAVGVKDLGKEAVQ
jgi:hypothetical protein